VVLPQRRTTFVRKPAPVFGPVLSPNAQTAVIAGNPSLQRTTDGGATWTMVGTLSTGATTDWGFTTSTQGFVISKGRCDDAATPALRGNE